MGLRIGIDVGGTNTDGVLLRDREVLAWTKRSTTDDISTGISDALIDLLKDEVEPESISAVMIGTTHFTNAVVQRRDLVPTGVVRLCLPAGLAVPPLYDWPADLLARVGNNTFLVHGGHEFNGREISALEIDDLEAVAEELIARHISTLAIVGVFAPVTADHEEQVAAYFNKRMPDLSITMSSEIGRLSLLERENATVLNASLAPLAQNTFRSFRSAIESLGITAELYITQNDGTLMSADHAEKYPVLTFSSGPTNSMRGAAFLTGIEDGVVIDIGGTTTDVGMLTAGFPREASFSVEIGGIRTNFRMPDLISIGLGGGSLVRDEGKSIGPDSVGNKVREHAVVFGGSQLTTTDIAVASGWAILGEPDRVADLDTDIVKNASTTIHTKVSDAIDHIRTSADPVPVVVVGGGSILVNGEIKGASELHRPEHFLVANAIGAAIAQVSGEVDQIFSMDGQSRQEVVQIATDLAFERAISAGAMSGTIEVVELEEIPLPYLPSSAIRIRVKTVGQLE